MFENKRPVGILRYNAEIMRDNGAPQEVIAKYLSDNGSSFTQISAVSRPNENEIQKMLASEKDGSFEKRKAEHNIATEQSLKDAKYSKWLENAQGVVRSAADGMWFGFGDEFESGVTGKPKEQIKQEQAQWEKQHPVANVVAGIGGAVVNPINSVFVPAKGASLGSKVLLGAAQGGLSGGLYGLGRGEGTQGRLTQAGKGALTGGVIGGAVPLAVEGIKQTVKGVVNLGTEGLGKTSGAGGESLKRGFDAGKRNSQVYKNAMRGKSSVYDVVDDVDRAVKTMEQNASAKYKAMLPDNGATLKLPDTEFKKALNEATKSISGVTSGVDDTAANAINKVHKLAQNIKANGGLTFDNANEAKKALDGIIEPLSRQGEKNAVRLLMPIKNALVETMEKAVPEYNGARAAFRADSRLIDSIKSALTSKDPTTELRKLQGITRQSVAAAQGGKQELGKLLDAVSGGKILDAIAGGQVTELMPRDPVRLLATGGALVSGATVNPATLATIPAMSPRLLGEGAFALGRAASSIGNATSKIPQTLIPSASKATTAGTLQMLKALGY